MWPESRDFQEDGNPLHDFFHVPTYFMQVAMSCMFYQDQPSDLLNAVGKY